MCSLVILHAGWLSSWGVNQRTHTGRGYIQRKERWIPLRTENLTRILNLASHTNRCYLSYISLEILIFRDIDVFSAFPVAALLGSTMGKALKTSVARNMTGSTYSSFACSPLILRDSLHTLQHHGRGLGRPACVCYKPMSINITWGRVVSTFHLGSLGVQKLEGASRYIVRLLEVVQAV